MSGNTVKEAPPPTTPKVPENAQEAANQLFGALGRIHPHGLGTVAVLADGTKVPLNGNPLDIAGLSGVLDGVKSGNILCGDARISSGVAAIIGSLKATVAHYQKESTERDGQEKERADYIVHQLSSIGHYITAATITPANSD